MLTLSTWGRADQFATNKLPWRVGIVQDVGCLQPGREDGYARDTDGLVNCTRTNAGVQRNEEEERRREELESTTHDCCWSTD